MSEQTKATATKPQSIAKLTPVSHGILQRCSNGVECEECRKKREGTLQRAAINTAPTHSAPPIVHDVLSSPGHSLDASTQAFMEPRFGHDFSGVRVHTDAHAAESARSVNALAYTVGRDVVFGAGQYAPGSVAGKRLLAHELTHVVQQSSGQIGNPITLSGINIVATEEEEAQRTAIAITQGKSLGPLSRGMVRIARENADAGVSMSTDAGTSPPISGCSLSTPAVCTSYEDWLGTFPKLPGSADQDITSSMPGDLQKIISGPLGANGNKPDCADVAMLLQDYYLKAKGQSLSFKVGPRPKTAETFKLGKGASEKETRICLINAGTESFQETRAGFKLVNFIKGKKGAQSKNLKDLIGSGLKPGNMLVWQRLAGITGNFQGHAQTIQDINLPQFDNKGKLLKEGNITVVQGNMQNGKGLGIIQRRVYTFKELTGKDDGNADIGVEPKNSEEAFFGAGPWIGS